MRVRPAHEPGKTPKTRVVATTGHVKVEPCIVTAVNGACDISLDLRALDAKVLAKMLKTAKQSAAKAAKKNKVTFDWKRVWTIEPRPFDPALMKLCASAVKEFTGFAPELPSGPLHDAAEMVPHMPTVMLFAQSSPGISHCKEEDTPRPHLDKSIRAFLRLVETTVEKVAAEP